MQRMLCNVVHDVLAIMCLMGISVLLLCCLADMLISLAWPASWEHYNVKSIAGLLLCLVHMLIFASLTS